MNAFICFTYIIAMEKYSESNAKNQELSSIIADLL